MTTISLPELSLVALIGISGSGKSSFAARHFAPTEVLSSDFCRGLVCSPGILTCGWRQVRRICAFQAAHGETSTSPTPVVHVARLVIAWRVGR
jgi:hypothetical protein